MIRAIIGAVFITLAVLPESSADPMTTSASPLIGTWTMKEKIGSKWFTDTIKVTAVRSTGYITAQDQYGSSVKGYAYNGVAFLADVAEDYFMDSYYWSYTSPTKFAKHMSVISYVYDFQSSWDVMTATKKTANTAESVPHFTSKAEEDQAKASAILALGSVREQVRGNR